MQPYQTPVSDKQGESEMMTSPYETTNQSRVTGYQESSVMSQSNPFDNSMARSEVEMVLDQMGRQR